MGVTTEEQSIIKTARKAEARWKSTGNHCGSCHVKKIRKPEGVTTTAWGAHICPWTKCPGFDKCEYKKGVLSIKLILFAYLIIGHEEIDQAKKDARLASPVYTFS